MTPHYRSQLAAASCIGIASGAWCLWRSRSIRREEGTPIQLFPDFSSADQRPVIGIVVGHALPRALDTFALKPVDVATPYGIVTLNVVSTRDFHLVVLYRHTRSCKKVAHEINHKANMFALKQAGVGMLLLTSSVGLCSEDIPAGEPLLISDLFMWENRLPDGSPCTYGEGYLLCDDKLFTPSLCSQFKREWQASGRETLREVTYAHQPGPRTKTPLENRYLMMLGVQANSMTLGPEVVLANELGIATLAVGIGHVVGGKKFGTATSSTEKFGCGDKSHVQKSLDEVDFSPVVDCFLKACDPVVECETQMHIRK